MSKYAELFKGGQVQEPQKPTAFNLLLVDDEESVLKALQRIFLDENYNIITAGDAAEALDVMRSQRIQLIISDYRMPGMNGAELLKQIKHEWPDTIRIMLTGYADVQSILGAINEGAVYKFITKPWNDDDLRLTVSLALQQYSLIQENKQLKEITSKQQDKIKNYSLMKQIQSPLANILLKLGVLTRQQLETVRRQRNDKEFILDTIVRLDIASESKLISALQKHLKMECIDLRETPVSTSIIQFLPRELCERHRIIPIRLEDKRLVLAMADPTDIYLLDNIEFMTGFRTEVYLARSSQISYHLERTYDDHGLGEIDEISQLEPLDEIDIVLEDEDDDTLTIKELMDSSEVPPIIRIVNAIISEAIRHKASDIHIEPKTKHSLVRYRIDGILHSKIKIPLDLHLSTISRIKILAKLDIAERRKPQDGRITVKLGTSLVDLRVSTLPTINGEKIVMRVLDKKGSIKRIDEVGLLEDDLRTINILIQRPQGIIISAGPTGSGKTTMLYSLLSVLQESSKNVETIEDPVEYFMEDANQIYVQHKIGLNFPNVLRATLRQDPDIILVGEVRDLETADVVFKAGLTGHMVLTSLHTNNSIATISRLLDIGIQPYLIASALDGVIAQRLVRTICQHCRCEVPVNQDNLRLLNLAPDSLGETLWQGQGCSHCNNTGYLGRTGLFEILVINDDFRSLINSSCRESELSNLARSQGMQSLLDDGLHKVGRGQTTLDELLRVLGAQTKSERTCPKCHRSIEQSFHFCPFCGTFKANICHKCEVVLNDDWSCCPHCGTQRAAGGKALGMTPSER